MHFKRFFFRWKMINICIYFNRVIGYSKFVFKIWVSFRSNASPRQPVSFGKIDASRNKKYGNSVALSIFANLSTRQLVSFHDSTFNLTNFALLYFTAIVWAFKRLERFHGQYNMCEIYLNMMRATVFAYEYKLKTSLAHRSYRSLQSAYRLNAETFDRSSMTIKTSLAFLRSLIFCYGHQTV